MCGISVVKLIEQKFLSQSLHLKSLNPNLDVRSLNDYRILT